MKKILILCISFLIPLSFQALAGKKESKNKIKSTTVMQTDYASGKPVTYKESCEEFDKNGNTVQYTEFLKDGNAFHKETYTYDAGNNLTEETCFDIPSGKNYKKTHKYTLVRDKTRELEETTFNSDGNVAKKIIYTYTATGKKASETTMDGKGKILKKQVYGYNAKDLRTTKQTFSEPGVLEEAKEWQYVYY